MRVAKGKEKVGRSTHRAQSGEDGHFTDISSHDEDGRQSGQEALVTAEGRGKNN